MLRIRLKILWLQSEVNTVYFISIKCTITTDIQYAAVCFPFSLTAADIFSEQELLQDRLHF